MAMTNADRQRAYRARHLQDIEGKGERINTVVSITSKRSLERLAIRYGVTRREMIERIIQDAESQLLASMKPAQQKNITAGNRRDQEQPVKDRPRLSRDKYKIKPAHWRA